MARSSTIILGYHIPHLVPSIFNEDGDGYDKSDGSQDIRNVCDYRIGVAISYPDAYERPNEHERIAPIPVFTCKEKGQGCCSNQQDDRPG